MNSNFKNYYKIPFLSPFLYKASSTVDKDSSLRDLIENNRQYYVQKWGGEPYREKYKTPFNIKMPKKK